jgi:hypothetical protein
MDQPGKTGGEEIKILYFYTYLTGLVKTQIP